MSAVPIGTMDIEKNGAIAYCDPNLARQLGVSASNVESMPWVLFFPLETLHVLTDVFSLFDSLSVDNISLSHVRIKDSRGIEVPFGISICKIKGEKNIFSLSFYPYSAHLEKSHKFNTLVKWNVGDTSSLSFIGPEDLSVLISIGTFTDFVITSSHDNMLAEISPIIGSEGNPVGISLGTNILFHELQEKNADNCTILDRENIPFGIIIADCNGIIKHANSIASSHAHDMNNSLVGKYIDVENISEYPLCSDVATFIDNATISICDVATFDSPMFVTLNESFSTYILIPHYIMQDLSYSIEQKGGSDVGTSVLNDIKTPLVTLGAYVSYLEEDLGLGAYDSLKKDIRSIKNALGQVSGQLERLGTPNEKNELEVRVSHIINRVLKAHSKELSNYAVKVDPSIDSVQITLDMASFGFIIDSLITFLIKENKYDEGGTITIGSKNSGEGVLIYVEDDAVTLSNELRESFLLDASSHVGPTSLLGEEMSMAISLIEKSNGVIWAEEPERKKGIMLWMHIPNYSSKAMCKFKDFDTYMALDR